MTKAHVMSQASVSGWRLLSEIFPRKIKLFGDERVSAGKTFSKEIAPYRMLARAPLRPKERSEGEKAIKTGPLPAGENGILLVIRQDGQEISDKVTVKIEVSERLDWF